MSQKLPSILAEKIAAKSKVFTVQAQHIEFSNGTSVHYERLLGSANGAVLIVPITENDEFMLIREYGAGVGRYELGFPKGKIDPGETWKEATIRESQEEIGYRPVNIELLESVSLASGYMTHFTHIVLAKGLSPASAEGDEPEPLEVLTWPIDDWQNLIVEPEFSEGRAYAAILLVLKRLGKI
ncbi:ADP compounds hydrolase NudE [Thiomicrorhabdus indica]|uniref:ADP compounds hydrolase NudE n=1 Tax=Thiomicrorhabdus indica TaxID=2267253 RepID=UPI002AA73E68|nr:ADP compounds hydrolase NudE [Thiomicrorhabdus indica]